jgi:hypothetical protein
MAIEFDGPVGKTYLNSTRKKLKSTKLQVALYVIQPFNKTGCLVYCLAVVGCRMLFSGEVLGVEGYKRQKLVLLEQFGDTRGDFINLL